jgi:CheY-like chemotaxis protein
VSTQQRDILVLDAGSEQMGAAVVQMRQLGYRVVAVKTPDQAHALLRFPSSTIASIVVPSDLAVIDLNRALRLMRKQAHTELTFLAAGARPELELRRQLRSAGVEFAVWDPVDPHTLRFQLNRSLASSDVIRRGRANPRAPAFLSVTLWAGRRTKHARLYSVSAGGAFLATEQPLHRTALFDLEIALPSGPVRFAAKVATTNVPGNLMRRNLPIGMGVSFLALPFDSHAALQLYVEERLRALLL